jgi:hypothetical protein
MPLGGLKFNSTHQLMAYDDDDDDNILGGSVHTIKRNTELIKVVSKKTGLEVNAEKNKYIGHVSRSECRRITVQRLIIVPLKGWNI